jgi:hypothetical protein
MKILNLLLIPIISAVSLSQADVTPVDIEAPRAISKKSGRGLSIWDLQVFDGKLFFGSGSTVDNVGPVAVWAYDLETQQWTKESTVKEEAIECFRIIDEKLVIPASDPKGPDDGKWYFRKPGASDWQRVATTAVRLAHVRDVQATPSGWLGVGNGREDNIQSPGILAEKVTEGFRAVDTSEEDAKAFPAYMFYSLITMDGEVLATNGAFGADNTGGFGKAKNGIARWDDDQSQLVYTSSRKARDFLPSQIEPITPDSFLRIASHIESDWGHFLTFRSYSLVEKTYKPGYMNSCGMAFKTDIEAKPVAVDFPDRGLVGMDAVARGSTVHALAVKQLSESKFTVVVYSCDSSSLHWKKQFQFDSETRALSLEEHRGVFYIGMGNHFWESETQSGKIWMITPED